MITSSAVLGLALVRSGWMNLSALGMNLAFSPAQTLELVLMTVSILKMWQFSALILIRLILTAASLAQVSSTHQYIPLQVAGNMYIFTRVQYCVMH